MFHVSYVKSQNVSTALHFPDPHLLLGLMKTCGKQKDLLKARRIHADIVNTDLLLKDLRISNGLLNMYVRCGAIEDVLRVFHELPKHTVEAWNAIIACYAHHGFGHEAIRCFMYMRDKGVSPNAFTFGCLLKACVVIGSLEIGEEIDGEIRKMGLLEDNVVLGTSLVDMYAKFGVMWKARQVFDEIPARNVITWNALISGYVHHGLSNEAIMCFEHMKDEGSSPNVVTFSCVLKACGNTRSLETGESIHAEVNKQGLLRDENIILGTAIVDMYAKCGVLGKAREVFDELPKRNIVSWNALIAGYAQHGCSHEALKCFELMQDQGFVPNAITFSCILKVCGSIGSIAVGERIHEEANKQGLLEENVVLGTALLDMYAKCGVLVKAREVFEKLPRRNVVSWTALIAGYTQHGYGDEALNCFKRMIDDGLSPNTVTFISILKACSSVASLKMGEEIHGEVKKKGLLGDMVLGTALVDMYAKCGVLIKAQEVFDELPERNVVSWSALVSGYAQHGLGEEAVKYFHRMQAEGVSPNAITFVSILKACGSIGSLNTGGEIHKEVTKQMLLEDNLVLGVALLDMYAKCGVLVKAQEVFDTLLLIQDVVPWNALMAGYAQLGHAKEVLNLFNKMRGKAIVPNLVTFLIMLTACSHAGLVEEGQALFNDMSIMYQLIPNLEHYMCMVDLFSRSGHFDKAIAVIETVQTSDRLPLWLVLLGACHKWINAEVGMWAFEQSVRMNGECGSAYVFMGNICAASGVHSNVIDMDALRVQTNTNSSKCQSNMCNNAKLGDYENIFSQQLCPTNLHWVLETVFHDGNS